MDIIISPRLFQSNGVGRDYDQRVKHMDTIMDQTYEYDHH